VARTINQAQKPRQAILIILACDFCGLVKPRHNGVEAEVDGARRFICAECCERCGAGSYSHVFGNPRLLASLLFTEAAP
jgi:hypothetical protein